MFVCGRINVGCNQGDWIEKRPGGGGRGYVLVKSEFRMRLNGYRYNAMRKNFIGRFNDEF